MVKMQQQLQGPPPPPKPANNMTNGNNSSNYPPPYRSPPNPNPAVQKQQNMPPPGAYSKFNVSEPNIVGGVGSPGYGLGSPGGYRHTINSENSQHMKHGLKNMLNASHSPKHQTLDSAGQSYALQQLRSNGLNPADHQIPHQKPNHQRMNSLQRRFPMPGDTYVSPDNLRDTANKLFSRNHQERSSVGGSGGSGANSQQFPPMQQQQQQLTPTINSRTSAHNGQEQVYVNQHMHNQAVQRQIQQQKQQQKQQQQQQQMRTPGARYSTSQMSPAGLQSTEDVRRNSYANQSLKRSNEQNTSSAKTPPQVPPKPSSRSTSKERLREPFEEIDNIDQELKHILKAGGVGSIQNISTLNQRLSLGGGNGTPPLPALSPDESPPDSFKPRTTKDQSNGTLPRNNDKDTSDATAKMSAQLKSDLRKFQDELGLTADLESVLGGLQADLTSDESTGVDVGEAAAIRMQLDGLESMYAEVLKLLGLRKYGRAPGVGVGLDGKRNRKLYGSMSSLPSVSSMGSRHIYKNGHHHKSGDKNKRSTGGGGSKERNYNKRFQRLESHVVTLARSVAHLSSEIRNQTLLMQEVEALRLEVQQLKGNAPAGSQRLLPGNQGPSGYVDPENFFTNPLPHHPHHHHHHGNHQGSGPSHPPGVNRVQANRVRKLTKFFGDEPPLLRLFLKNLGYEKYASVFEDAKIGLLELPYLSDDKLDKLGIPVGPRMRILQEARATIANEPNYNVYIL